MGLLHRQKIINIIANTALEKRLVEMSIRHGATGYTVLDARGGGGSGEQSGTLVGDSNILMMMIVPDEVLEKILAELDGMIEHGHHMVVYVKNTEVMRPGKFK